MSAEEGGFDSFFFHCKLGRFQASCRGLSNAFQSLSLHHKFDVVSPLALSFSHFRLSPTVYVRRWSLGRSDMAGEHTGVELERLEQPERFYDREALLGRDTSSVFPSTSKSALTEFATAAGEPRPGPATPVS